ncbi:MAG: TetR/AcrR family transcriptional regulator [Propionibacteriaceae bacterium]|jgi:AcrR family transcriptional regulator|nr:TetR/AcrR family transcriptional regulator [Propionibacteriaceae bacterium]
MSPKPYHPQQTRDSIIAVATDLFARKGFEKTTMRDIVDGIGMSKGAIFHHFDSKEQILQAVVQRMCDGLLEAGRRASEDRSQSVPDRLVKTILAMQINNELGQSIMAQLSGGLLDSVYIQVSEAILEQGGPILIDIVNDGVDQKVFDTSYPRCVVEVLVGYSQRAFAPGPFMRLNPAEQQATIEGFIDCMERLTGAAKGSLDSVRAALPSVTPGPDAVEVRA